MAGIQANFCKNPGCANFGIPETPHRARRALGAEPMPGDYSLVSTGKGKPALKCGLCADIIPLRSNLAIAEEVRRLISCLEAEPEGACTNPDCAMHEVPISEAPANYVRFGKTAAGTPRWRCNTCRTTFSLGGKATKKQRMAHKNRDVFSLLMNKSPLNRMAEVTGLDKKSLYGKIDFIHRQCLRFAGDRELQLKNDIELPKMYVAVDRQAFVVNWSSRKDRRNVQLNAIASADLASSYVFGMHLNFDGSLNPAEVEADAIAVEDYEHSQPFRKYARLWLKQDYDEAVKASAANASIKAAKARAKASGADELNVDIAAEYDTARLRDDVEDTDGKDSSVALPVEGMQVHEQYTLYAHFLILARLLARAPKVRLYLDQDSGFRAGVLNAFHQRIKNRTADAFYVRVLKESTIDEKDAAITKSRAAFRKYQRDHPDLSPFEVQVLMVKDEMARMANIGHWGDRWLVHPLPNKSEPDKRVCWLTDMHDYEADHAARLYLKATLHPVDRFFMQARRRLSLAERGVPSASSMRRIWHGYSAYKPQNLGRVLEIFRVFYNYCSAGEDGKTPAMRLGLARGPVRLEDVIYFSV